MGSDPLDYVGVSQIRHISGRFPQKVGRGEKRPKTCRGTMSLQGG